MKFIETFPLRLASLGLLIQASLTLLLAYGDLAGRIVETIAVLFLSSIFYLCSVWLVLSKRLNGLWLVLVFALCFRLALLTTTPTLSDDLFRYRWSGLMQLRGGSPYTSAPSDPAWTHLRDTTYNRIPVPEARFAYGPLWTLTERATALAAPPGLSVNASVLFFKLPSAAADLAIICLLLLMLRRRGMPTSRVLIYAWCPLPVVEFWHSGHNDSLMILLLLAAVELATRLKPAPAGALAIAAAAVKFWPALWLPALALHFRRRWPALLAGAAAGTLLFLPHVNELADRAGFVSGFLGGWRNNDSLFALVALLAPGAEAAKLLSIALIGVSALWIAHRRLTPEHSLLWLITAILLVSANVHPWYLTWFIPLLVFHPSTPHLLWTSLMPLAYAVHIGYRILGEWNGSTAWRWYIYVPVFAFAIIGHTIAVSAQRKERG